MNVKVGTAAEDYLKTIYEITRRVERASTNEIAEQMGVRPASVTGMVRRLAEWEPPLLDYEKHRGAALTQAGEHIALEIIRHHRLLETFLHEKLGYTWDEVHHEADQLEHVISEDLEDRIAEALGNPDVDPHGDPIPSRAFEMPQQSKLRLAEMESGERARVVRIDDDNPDLLRYLASVGLGLNSRVTIGRRYPFDDNIEVHIDGQESGRIFGLQITRKIYVESERMNQGSGG